MKYKVHIPTEQYGFVEVEFEQETGRSVADVYTEVASMFKPQEGLSPKDFNTALDRYLSDGTGETNTYLAMSPAQKQTIQDIKRAFKRLEARDGKLKDNDN